MACVHCRGVIPIANMGTDGRVGTFRVFPKKVHGDLAGECQPFLPTLPEEIFNGEVVVTRNDFEKLARSDIPFRNRRDEALEQGLDGFDRWLDILELVVGDDFIQSALKFSDIGLHGSTDETEDFRIERVVFSSALGFQNSDARFKVR